MIWLVLACGPKNPEQPSAQTEVETVGTVVQTAVEDTPSDTPSVVLVQFINGVNGRQKNCMDLLKSLVFLHRKRFGNAQTPSKAVGMVVFWLTVPSCVRRC